MSRGLGDVYKRQLYLIYFNNAFISFPSSLNNLLSVTITNCSIALETATFTMQDLSTKSIPFFPIYELSNTTNFILGPNNNLYIIYPYGNSNFTDAMDVVVF